MRGHQRCAEAHLEVRGAVRAAIVAAPAELAAPGAFDILRLLAVAHARATARRCLEVIARAAAAARARARQVLLWLQRVDGRGLAGGLILGHGVLVAPEAEGREVGAVDLVALPA